MATELFAIVGFYGDPRSDEGDVVCEYATGLMNQTNDHTPYQAEAIEKLMDHESELLGKVLDGHIELAEDAVKQYSVLGADHPDLLEAQEHLAEVNQLRDALKEGRYVKLP